MSRVDDGEPPGTIDWWASEKETIVVAEQMPISVYTAVRDDVAIRSRIDDDEDVVILVRPENVPTLARALLVEVGLEGLLAPGYPRSPFFVDPREGETVDDEQEDQPAAPKDRTAAERQRRRRAAMRGDLEHRDIDPDVTAEDRDTGAPERDVAEAARDGSLFGEADRDG